MSEKRRKIVRKSIEAANSLSLGISIVAAVLIGVGLGILMKKLTGLAWLFWVGVFWGLAGALLNVYKAYKAQLESYKEFEERDCLAKEARKKE